MGNIPDNCKFLKSHEWVKVEGTTALIGISDHAQHALGDIVFVDLPAPGKELKAGSTFGTIESVKAAEDLYSPVTGTVEAVNEALKDNPALVNTDPHGAWFIKVKNATVSTDALDAASYTAYLKTLEH